MTTEDNKQQKTLSWKDLTAGGDLQSLALPEFGGAIVWLKPLPARPLVLFNEMPDTTPEEIALKRNTQFELIAEAMVTEDGKRLAPDGEIGNVLDIPMASITAIMTVVLSGVTGESAGGSGAEGND